MFRPQFDILEFMEPPTKKIRKFPSQKKKFPLRTFPRTFSRAKLTSPDNLPRWQLSVTVHGLTQNKIYFNAEHQFM